MTRLGRDCSAWVTPLRRGGRRHRRRHVRDGDGAGRCERPRTGATGRVSRPRAWGADVAVGGGRGAAARPRGHPSPRRRERRGSLREPRRGRWRGRPRRSRGSLGQVAGAPGSINLFHPAATRALANAATAAGGRVVVGAHVVTIGTTPPTVAWTDGEGPTRGPVRPNRRRRRPEFDGAHAGRHRAAQGPARAPRHRSAGRGPRCPGRPYRSRRPRQRPQPVLVWRR